MADRPLPDEPLFTPEEAAKKLSISVRQLKEHVASGKLRFINVGAGKMRRRLRFTSYNLATFIENQKVRETPECPSTKAPKVHTTGSTFKSTAAAFSALPKPGTKKTPKP